MFSGKNKIFVASFMRFLFTRPEKSKYQSVISTIPLIWYMMKFYFYKIVDKIFDVISMGHSKVHKIKYSNKNKKIVVKIHFLLALDAIKSNQLSDATLRFWLVSKFIPTSNALYYHLAFLNYLKGNIKKSAMYVFKIKNTDKYNTYRVRELIKRIKRTNYDILQKIDFKI